MNWDEQLKEAHSHGGPLAVSTALSRIFNEARKVEGISTYSTNQVTDGFRLSGLGHLVPVIRVSEYVLNIWVFYEINLRSKSDTPLRQARELFTKLRIIREYPREVFLPEGFEFMFDVIQFMVEETLGDFNAVQRAQEAKYGLGETLTKFMIKLADELIQHSLTGPNIEAFKQRAMLAKLGQ